MNEKPIIIIFLLVAGLIGFCEAHAQEMKLLFDENLTSDLFDSNDSIANPDYEILAVSGYDDIDEPKSRLIGSTCQVNEDEFRTIHFTQGKVNNDKILIEISETNPAYHHVISIEIKEDQLEVEFEMNQSGPLLERTYLDETAEVTLKSRPLMSGDWIYGRLKYKATMVIDGTESPIVVMGDFKTKLE